MKKRSLSCFLIVILSLTLLLSFYVPNIQAFDGTGGEFGNWVWDGANRLLTIVANSTANAGNTEANAYACVDVTNAIDYYGWNATYDKSSEDKHFEYNFRIEIGNGTETTWFVDTQVQILGRNYTDTTSDFFIKVKNNGHLRFGEVINLVAKSTTKGVAVITHLTPYETNIIDVDTGGEALLYSCYFQRSPTAKRFLITGTGTIKLWNCILEYRSVIRYGNSNSEIFNVIATYPDTGFSNWMGTVDRYTCYSSVYADVYVSWNFPITLRNVYSRLGAYFIRAPNLQADVHVVDADVDNWNIYFYGTNYGGKIFREYTMDVTLHHVNGSYFEGANITLTYHGNGGGYIGSWLTNSTGQIPSQTIVSGFYNMTGGSNIYTYNPYNVVIAAEGYRTKEWNFSVIAMEAWNFAMFPETEPETSTEYVYDFVTPMGMGLGLAVVFGIIFSMVIVKRREPKPLEETEYESY